MKWNYTVITWQTLDRNISNISYVVHVETRLVKVKDAHLMNNDKIVAELSVWSVTQSLSPTFKYALRPYVFSSFINHRGLALLTLSWDKNWDSHSLVNGYPSFYPRIGLVAPSPDGHFMTVTAANLFANKSRLIYLIESNYIQMKTADVVTSAILSSMPLLHKRLAK